MTDDTERRTQTTQLYERLRTSILTLELLPGQSLAERGLETRFEASRTPVRAALVRLEAEGLVRRDGRSFAVAPIDLGEIGQLAEYREAVETAAVRLAVQRASDDDLDALADELTSMAEANAAGDSMRAGDSVQAGGDFHSRLAQLAGNPFFSTAVASSLRRLERTRWLEASSADSREHARDEHLRILAAVRARDADLAAALIAEHIRGTHERLREALSSDEWRRAHAVP
ncbi:GntR family transcriptional regulator [Agreia sp. VKM Ac-1783]|uniref:GntR family transcriptional regulator n=1 Tax=Agreia sp. VKM Ac-1783 TaxID=1938889 RepID=UPI000A3987B0|nr:GntR family transcriptional regulator [Agreia sp. VKM Ac-1783]